MDQIRPLFLILLLAICLGACSESDTHQSEAIPYAPSERGNDSIPETKDSVPDTKKDSISKPEPIAPELITMAFLATNNPKHIKSDVNCEIIGDSIVECWLPGIHEDKVLIPNFSFEGDSVVVTQKKIISGETKINFKRPFNLSVLSGYKTRTYTVYVHTYTGLPILWIDTENHQQITSKYSYLDAHMKLEEDVVTRLAGEIVEADLQIKGHGNTTWSSKVNKKSFRLKFSDKVSLLGEPKNKSWVLLANYYDKTMLRNQIASYLGSISLMDYTPKFHFVELMLNEKYNGTYQLGDKINVNKHRVNVGDDGYLLEFDARATSEDITIKVQHQQVPIVIKEPDLEDGDERYNYIHDYILEAEECLFSSKFTDPDLGWKKYMDMDSFVDWYLINEIAKNNDACLFTSCFLNLQRGGKLKMGPIWDFDMAFGRTSANSNDDPKGFWIRKTPWFKRMFEDPAFKARVKERFDYFYSHRYDIMKEIDDNVKYLQYSVVENEHKWSILKSSAPWDKYQKTVDNLIDWILQRFEWLKANY